MATRAIRKTKLNYQSYDLFNQATQWLSWNQNDEVIQIPLQDAVRHNITFAGDSAADIQNNINTMRSEMNGLKSYYQVLNSVYGTLIPFVLNRHIVDVGMNSIMRDKLIQARNIAKANTTNGVFDGWDNVDFKAILDELSVSLRKIAFDLNAQFGEPIVTVSVNYNLINHSTTDAQISAICETVSPANFGHSIWRINTYRLLKGGYGASRSTSGVNHHIYPTLQDDVLEAYIEHIVDNNPILAIKIAHYDQMFQDNPIAKSIGHSWTSRNRSGECYFHKSAGQVFKNHTTVFSPPRKMFRQFTPEYSHNCAVLDSFKDDVLAFLDDSSPALKHEINKVQKLDDMTQEAAKKSLVNVVQGLLDDQDTVALGTAIIGHIAGIAHLPINASDVKNLPNGYIQYEYKDYHTNRDMVAYIYPQHLFEAAPLTDFNLTDEVLGVLYKAYQDNLTEHRNRHAQRCAQLARQIAQETTRHDTQEKVLTDAFRQYQTQV